MSTRGTPLRPSGTSHEVVPAGQIRPNAWNPNRMSAFMYAKALESITEYGFLDPLTVWRPGGTGYEIIDGEHRWRAGRDLGMASFPCTVVENITAAQARKLTLVLNELHGQSDPADVADLLRGILEEETPEQMLVGMPFTDDVLKGFLGFDPLPPMPAPPPAGSSSPGPGAAAGDRWVERTYRMPEAVAEVLDEALDKARARAREGAEPFELLEVLAAEYLAS